MLQSDWVLKQQRFERTKMRGKKLEIFNFLVEILISTHARAFNENSTLTKYALS